MRKRLLAVFATMIMAFSFAPPAEAHVETCTLSAYSPKIVVEHILRASVRWYCTPPTHHEFNHIDVRVQYKIVHMFWPDGWATIPPNNYFNTTSMNGTAYDAVYCANGTKTYRTHFSFDMYGTEGVRHHSTNSGETTKKCGFR